MWARTPLLAVTALLALAAPAAAGTIHVKPGQSIQAAVAAARPGDTVKVHPGTYTERGTDCRSGSSTCAVLVTKNNIRLVGAGTKAHPVVLEAKRGQDVGIAVSNPVEGKCPPRSKRLIHRS